MLRWAGADLAEYEKQRTEKSHASVEARLDERKRYLLEWRRRGWPWNGYELQQMWNAGKYPPERLTPAQERIFLVNRRRNRA